MKTYWDYTDIERSVMTAEQVTSLLDVELMTKGVLRPVAPTLEDVPANPLGERRTYYGMEGKSKYGSDEHVGICFETLEQATQFLALNPLKREYDYEVGSEFNYAIPLREVSVKPEPLYSTDQINQFRSQMKQRKAAADNNRKLQDEYSKATTLAEKITDGVWSDWHEQRNRAGSYQRIVDTYRDYFRLTDGDEQLALTFLGKVHDSGEIAKAREWFPSSIPDRIAAISEVEAVAAPTADVKAA